MNAPKSLENRHGFLHYTELSRRLRESEIVRRAAMLRSQSRLRPGSWARSRPSSAWSERRCGVIVDNDAKIADELIKDLDSIESRVASSEFRKTPFASVMLIRHRLSGFWAHRAV
jgi:hypothetical protein